MSEPSKQQEHPKPSAGEILKQTRESKGISLSMVHDATKIPLDALKAIEEGYKVRSLSPFYIKGFIKMYAQYLGVDVSEVRDDYRREELPKPIKKVDTAEAFENNFNKIFTRDRQKLIVQILAGLLVLFVVVKIAGCFRHGDSRNTKRKTSKATSFSARKKNIEPVKKVAPKVVPKKETPKKAEVRRDTTPQPKKQSPASATQEAKNVRLTIKTRKNGWLQVKVDGNVVFQSTINQGAVESWEADKKIELSGKNIHNLEFEVNGRLLGALGRADRNARRVIITKDGLSVKE